MTVDSYSQLTILGGRAYHLCANVSVKSPPESTVQELPHWGSWQGAALTDEGRGTAPNIVKTMGAKVLRTVAAAICRHPAHRAGTVVRLYL